MRSLMSLINVAFVMSMLAVCVAVQAQIDPTLGSASNVSVVPRAVPVSYPVGGVGLSGGDMVYAVSLGTDCEASTPADAMPLVSVAITNANAAGTSAYVSFIDVTVAVGTKFNLCHKVASAAQPSLVRLYTVVDVSVGKPSPNNMAVWHSLKSIVASNIFWLTPTNPCYGSYQWGVPNTCQISITVHDPAKVNANTPLCSAGTKINTFQLFGVLNGKAQANLNGNGTIGNNFPICINTPSGSFSAPATAVVNFIRVGAYPNTVSKWRAQYTDPNKPPAFSSMHVSTTVTIPAFNGSPAFTYPFQTKASYGADTFEVFVQPSATNPAVVGDMTISTIDGNTGISTPVTIHGGFTMPKMIAPTFASINWAQTTATFTTFSIGWPHTINNPRLDTDEKKQLIWTLTVTAVNGGSNQDYTVSFYSPNSADYSYAGTGFSIAVPSYVWSPGPLPQPLSSSIVSFKVSYTLFGSPGVPLVINMPLSLIGSSDAAVETFSLKSKELILEHESDDVPVSDAAVFITAAAAAL